MARTTTKRLPQRETTAARVVLLEPGTNPLVWQVPATGERRSFVVDLQPFFDGNPKLGLPARPNLISQLAPAFRQWALDKIEGSINSELAHVRTFWRFLAALDTIGQPLEDDVLAITPSVGVLLKGHLLTELRLGNTVSRRCLKRVVKLVESARQALGVTPAQIVWPTVQESRGTVHKDVAPASMRALYHCAKNIARRFGIAVAEGERLLGRTATVPPNGKIDWSDRCQVVAITRQYLDVLLGEPSTSTRFLTERKFHRRSEKTPAFPTGYHDGKTIDRFRWFVPLAEDAVASAILVLLHTGWNVDTVFNIDVSTPDAWCQERLAGNAGGTVALFGHKGKTGREQVAFSLERPEFHPYRVIKNMVARTEPLRAWLRERLSVVESEPKLDTARQNEIVALRQAISSPWLFLRTQGESFGTGRIGVLETNGTFRGIFDEIVVRSGLQTELTPSDLRDGFAGFLYSNSLYNTLLVKRALGHSNLSATKHYLRQRRMLSQRFADYTEWSNAMFDEIRRFQVVDPTILYVRARFVDVTEDQRRRLADHRLRTRMGMGCLEPTQPSPQIAPDHAGGTCTVQRCTLCRHGVVFPESFIPLARRLAELHVIRGQTPIDRWEASSFRIEWMAIEATVEHAFPARGQEFTSHVDQHIDRLRRGHAYLFDQHGVNDVLEMPA
ncbi:tyrosine-type recombinase/integrase [Burkholderia cenocepacia]|uniref:tyrosine-type recombinase/integrase n=1 Tax=Burkholderia cepacia complex TaxID=87882 RepID=UPI000CFFD75D|nr:MULTISPECIES: tyrosine-type recombinase/integrase [Burkholderia cepacia complex]MBR8381801.1 tyrosine-type recombinase/integrase [Burkholderia cenocepacia]MBR8434947.1 tyrosine-type recombinase/integrase [Burkholderia cenocepacia]PRG95787.1 hypothetical protein C6V04_06945 [Burkholderia multivorans]